MASPVAIFVVLLIAPQRTKIFRFASWVIEARHFAALSSSIPYIFVYNDQNSIPFLLVSPWLASILEALPFKMGHWIRYTKKDFAWFDKGSLAQEELGSDI